MTDKKNIPFGVTLASMLLNAFLLGILITGFLFHGHFPPGHAGRFMHLQQAAQKLNSPYKEKVLAILDQKKPGMEADEQNLSGRFGAIGDALTAPIFDPSRLKTADSGIKAADDAMKTDMMDLMVSIATILPNDQRILFFKAMAPPHDHDHGPPSP